MKRYTLERVYLSDRTLGSWLDGNQVDAKILELPWKNNARKISCIPEGIYRLTKEPPKEGRPYPYFRVHNVPGRDGILVHRGVKPIHSLGCLLAGSRFAEANTNTPILESSTVKLQWMTDNYPDEFELEIKKKPTTL